MSEPTRRKALEKAAKFVIPTIAAFTLSEIKVSASGCPTPGSTNKPTPKRWRRRWRWRRGKRWGSN